MKTKRLTLTEVRAALDGGVCFGFREKNRTISAYFYLPIRRAQYVLKLLPGAIADAKRRAKANHTHGQVFRNPRR